MATGEIVAAQMVIVGIGISLAVEPVLRREWKAATVSG
jgi:hypothetical protein